MTWLTVIHAVAGIVKKLGKDKEAQQNVDQAAGLGLDRGVLGSTIEEFKQAR